MSTADSDSIAHLLEMNREEIVRLAAMHGARNVRIFGSVANGRATTESDLDMLVDFESGRSLLDRIALMQDLEDLLGMKVDVVTARSVHRDLQAEILRDAKAI